MIRCLCGGNIDQHLFLFCLRPSLIPSEWEVSPPPKSCCLCTCGCCVTSYPLPSCSHPVLGLMHLQWLPRWPCCHLGLSNRLTPALGFEPRQNVHAWQGGCTVFQLLCKPGIMLFCILFFSLNVLVERFLIMLNIIFR